MKPNKILNTTIKMSQRYQNWMEIMLAIARKQYPAKVILKNGTRFEAKEVFSWLVDEIFFERVYLPAPLYIEKNDIVVDIGAHIGVFSIFAASQTQNTIYAFEPFPHTFASLKRNISVNRLNNVIPLGFAVSDKIGTATLLLNPQRNTGHMLVDHAVHGDMRHADYPKSAKSVSPALDEYIEVPTTTLQDIMDSNNIAEIGFLKMDCEGAEGSILASTPEDYLQRIKKIAIEFHDHLSKINHDDMRARLEAAGFITELKKKDTLPFGYLYGWRDGLSRAK